MLSLDIVVGGKEFKVKDTELYAALLGLRPPWGIREVRLDLAADRGTCGLKRWRERSGVVRSAGGRFPCTTMPRSARGDTWILATARPICMLGCPVWSARSTGCVRWRGAGPFPCRTLA